jgi:hypothetical protein
MMQLSMRAQAPLVKEQLLTVLAPLVLGPQSGDAYANVPLHAAQVRHGTWR